MIKTAMLYYILDTCIDKFFDPLIIMLNPESVGIYVGRKFKVMCHKIEPETDYADMVAYLQDVEITGIIGDLVYIKSSKVIVNIDCANTDNPKEYVEEFMDGLNMMDASDVITGRVEGTKIIATRIFEEGIVETGIPIKDIVLSKSY
jgi:hypothetical protein